MQRRDFLKIATVSGLTTTAVLSSVPINLLSHQGRNVLFIAVDDLKPLIGAYGATQAHTPHIDRLAKRGIIFKNNHCQQAVCGPSRAIVWDLKTTMLSILPDVVILPQYFMNHGYITRATGKIYDGRCIDNGRGWVSQDVPSWSRPARKVNGTRYARQIVQRLSLCHQWH